MDFVHRTLAQTVRFGAGRGGEHLREELAARGFTRVMLVASGRELDRARTLTSGVQVEATFSDVAGHVPAETAQRARQVARSARVDVVVAVGGGSAIGLGKAIALTESIPVIAVPTTYSGSEATNVWGITEGGRKTTGVDDRVLPIAIVYDAALTLSLPRTQAIASGLNAIAHCIDAMWAPNTDPLTQAMAEEGIRALADGMRGVAREGSDLTAREHALRGAYVSAVAFAAAGSGLHHKICHVLGGRYDLPHAQTHAAVLPHVLAFNAPAAPDAAVRIARALGATDAVDALDELYVELHAPRALAALGYRAEMIPESVRLILPAIPPSNPRPVGTSALSALLAHAMAGDRPDSTAYSAFAVIP